MRNARTPTSTDEWLARVPEEQRAALEKLRAQILAAAPGAEQTIAYGMPTFQLHGHLVAFGAFKRHLSFFPMSSALLKTLPEAAPYASSTGTMRFQPGKPIPAALIKKIVKARIAQNLEVASERAAAKKAKTARAKKKK